MEHQHNIACDVLESLVDRFGMPTLSVSLKVVRREYDHIVSISINNNLVGVWWLRDQVDVDR